jgi:hypothetical protein
MSSGQNGSVVQDGSPAALSMASDASREQQGYDLGVIVDGRLRTTNNPLRISWDGCNS